MDCYALARSQTQHFTLLNVYQLPKVVMGVCRLKLVARLAVWILYQGTSHGGLSRHVIYFSQIVGQLLVILV